MSEVVSLLSMPINPAIRLIFFGLYVILVMYFRYNHLVFLIWRILTVNTAK